MRRSNQCGAAGASTTWTFLSPTRFSFRTRVATSRTLLAVGIGSCAGSTTTRRQECVAAVGGGVQSHSSTSGRFGERFAIVLAVPIGFQIVVVPLPGNAVQKFAGRFGSPGLASA